MSISYNKVVPKFTECYRDVNLILYLQGCLRKALEYVLKNVTDAVFTFLTEAMKYICFNALMEMYWKLGRNFEANFLLSASYGCSCGSSFFSVKYYCKALGAIVFPRGRCATEERFIIVII